MRRRFKVVVLAAFLVPICVVAVMVLFTQKSPSRPDFRVYGVKGQVITDMWVNFFTLSFGLENNGTAAAHNVTGTAKYEKNGQWRSADWRLMRLENVLEAGEKAPSSQCFATFNIPRDSLLPPSEKFVITVLCNEGVLREFNVTIPG